MTNISGKGETGSDPQKGSEIKVVGEGVFWEGSIKENEILVWECLM